MKPLISRPLFRTSLVLICACLVLFLIGFAFRIGALIPLSLPLLLIGGYLRFLSGRCPYCGQVFRGLFWSSPDAGYCVKCGNLMEFDDGPSAAP